MAKLWDYFDGEPFLTNPRLGIIGLNPRGKKGKKMAARKRKARRVSRRRTSRSKSRKSPTMQVRLVNPRRKKTGRRRTVARRRTSSMRRNPAIMGITLPPITSVIFAGVGFIAPPMVEGFLSRFLPTSISTSTIGKYAIRIASVAGLTYAVKTFVGSAEARMTAIGGGVYVLSSAVREFAPGVIPGLGAYVIPGVPVQRQLGAYVPANQPINTTLGNGAFPVGGIPAAGATANRFKRY